QTTDRQQGLAIDRAYLTLKYNMNSDWMMRITTDVHLDTGLSKKNNNIFLKYAYVQGKLLGDAVVLRLGQSHTPWIDHEEHLWAHRYASPVFIDKHGFDASSDLGIGLKGKLADGLVKYWVTETDGAGYSHPGMHQDTAGNWQKGLPKAFDFDSRIGIYPIEGLTLDFQFRDGYKGTKYYDAANNRTTPGTKHRLWQVMATYGMGHDWRVGANYVQEKSDRKADVLNAITAQTDKTTGYALWGWTRFGDSSFGAYGRYDYDQKTRDTVPGIKQKTSRYLLGLEYFPAHNVTLSLVYDYSKTTNNKLTKGAIAKNTTYGLYSQFKF
ncbi:MAG: hypothetical protein D6755_02645, partial [Anaerolineae bacterium]